MEFNRRIAATTLLLIPILFSFITSAAAAAAAASSSNSLYHRHSCGHCSHKPPSATVCPIDAAKLGACVDLLGEGIHIGFGECCPMLSGLVELEAAVCLCTTLKLKALNLNIFVPLALQLLLTCGKLPPPGYTCSL